jgi:tetratricopeptide (TPR) repeat protein
MKNLIDPSLAPCRAFRRLRLGFEGLGNLAHDGFGSCRRVRSLGDGTAHNKVVGAGPDGVSRRGDALLVTRVGAGRPDARNHQHASGTGENAHRGHLLWGADESADASSYPHPCQRFNLFGGHVVYCDGFELLGIHTGEDRDSKEFGRIRQRIEGAARRGKHGRPAERVQSNHACAVAGGRTHGAGHGVGNIVKLEIEKDRMTAPDERFDGGRTSGGEEFEADFEPVTMVFEPVHQLKSGRHVGRVQSNNKAAPRFCDTLGGKSGRRAHFGEGGVQPIGDGHNPIVIHDAIGMRSRDGRRSDRAGDLGLTKASLGMRAFVLALALLCAGGKMWGEAVDTNPMNYDPQVRAAYAAFHNLDFKDAVAGFERYHLEHPGNPQATAYLLNAVVFQELYRLDLLDTTFYANDGFLSGKHATPEDPKVRARVMALTDEVVREANWRLSQNPNDVNALFARGWARSIECAYIAMVERGFRAGFSLASKAKDDEVRVLQLDPNYADAKLVVGVYQYVVGALPWPFKFLIGFAGITGSKMKGMALLRDAGEHGVITGPEARTVMALFLRREGKYKQAIQIIRGLETEYPRNFLFRLEEANLRKDDGEGMVAVEAYRRVIADARKPGYFASSKLELAEFGLGEALRGQRHYQQAARAYEHAAQAEDVGAELKIRSLVAGGQCRDMADQRELAVSDYREAIQAGPETTRADTARRYLRSPYRGT